MNFKVPWIRENTFFTADSCFGFCYIGKCLVFCFVLFFFFFYSYSFCRHHISPKFVSTLSYMVSVDCPTSSSSVLVI